MVEIEFLIFFFTLHKITCCGTYCLSNVNTRPFFGDSGVLVNGERPCLSLGKEPFVLILKRGTLELSNLEM